MTDWDDLTPLEKEQEIDRQEGETLDWVYRTGRYDTAPKPRVSSWDNWTGDWDDHIDHEERVRRSGKL